MLQPPSTPALPDRYDAVHRRRLFIICCLAITTASMSFVLRSSIAQDIQTTLFDPIDPLNSATLIGSALGVAFLSMATAVAIGSPLLDAIGMRNLLALCGLAFVAGTGLTIFADQISSGPGVYNIVWLGMLLSGMGWGCSEAVINPLTTAVYPDDKTHKLNVLHAWWPAGIIIGGLLGLGIGALDFDWRFKFAVVLLPACALLGLLLVSGNFPKTERAAAGIPASEMFRACLTPAFLLWFLCMFLTASAELGPGQWVDLALTRTVGISGIWLLVYVSGLMFVMRHFAGPLVHRLSVVGLLWVSCLLAAIGLVALSVADSPVTGFLAATVWGTGVCFMWPTMLGVAAERFPRSGALGMGLIGTAGSLATYFLLPQMGRIFDEAKIEAAGGEAAFTALSGDALTSVLAQASTESFRIVALMPAILLIVFGLVWINDRRKGGFRPQRLQKEVPQEQPGVTVTPEVSS